MKKLAINLAVIALIGCTVAVGLSVQDPTFNVGATESALRAVLNHLHFGLADFDATNYGFARARIVRAQEETQALYDDLFESPPPVPPPVDPGIPELSDVTVLFPGTASVLDWLIVVELDMIARLDGDEIRIEWPALLGDWPTSIHDLSSEGPRPYFGVTGWIYRTGGGRWVAHPNEYARPDREQRGTYWNWSEKFKQAAEDNPGIELGVPDAGTPVGIFIAGMWRHTNDLEEYRRRSEIVWFTWPELEPWRR
ncbi:hypothetical protein LCGC14_1747580 [marine sediment metagenome]|uniref:Uncharacterized protein n=1 Tax=marine sediment metagenome TaxID=412755 RepID=A0A0F9K495_9ZZZZ